MICISLFIENGISRVQNIESALTQLGNGQIKDLKFMDDDLLLVLWDSCGTPTVSQWAHVLTPPQGQEVFSAYSTTTYRLA
jgi:anaphase-promoting complex subunit 4